MTRDNMIVGQLVRVRSRQEIEATLDANGELEGMPFMPEMFEYCGKTFQIYKSAHKTCDTVFPVRGRRVKDAVHLSTRCSGAAHGGCQAGCLIFWKTAWLETVSSNGDTKESGSPIAMPGDQRAEPLQQEDSPDKVYSCQATKLPTFTTNLEWWDFSQYIEDIKTGNVSIATVLRGMVYVSYYNISQAGLGLGRILEWIYDRLHPLWNGTLFPRKVGRIAVGQPTPHADLNLRPGELVRVKSHEEILKTLSTANQNRGLLWDAEMVPFCGGTYRVHKRVDRIINERTGRMMKMKTPCIVLEDVFCKSKYSSCRMFCPRSIYSYWREMWLERVEPARPVRASSTGEREVATSSH